MAVVPYVRVDTETATTITWANMQIADTGEKVNLADFDTVKTIHQVSGGAATAQLRRSNDGTNFVNNGSALAANSITDITSAAKWWDINPTAAAICTVILTARKLLLKG